MSTVIVTDVRYRTASAVIRPLAKAGYQVIAVQTAKENPKPPAFLSRFVEKTVLLDGSVKDEAYADRLLAVCKKFDQPALFPIGADTLDMLSKNADKFAPFCKFLVSPPEILDAANDKRTVARVARERNLPVPEEFDCTGGKLPPRFPVILKPRCGEKLNLHAEQRYAIAENDKKFQAVYAKMSSIEENPIVQEQLIGDGTGVCLVMDKNSQPVCLMGHRRLREYPISGGPSTLCEGFYDRTQAEIAVKLLQAMGFVGIAMVEFKDSRILEINPRIWGSFPLTEVCGSRFALWYVRAANGETPELLDSDFIRGRKMRFILNDTLACLSYLKKGQFSKVFRGLFAKDALFRFTDQRVFWRYLLQTLKGGGQ